jgi:hypothetical protein
MMYALLDWDWDCDCNSYLLGTRFEVESMSVNENAILIVIWSAGREIVVLAQRMALCYWPDQVTECESGL